MMKPISLPTFAGNDIWIFHRGAKALVVDPDVAAALQAAPDAQGPGLAAILVTHRHADPVGGMDAPSVRRAAHCSA